MDRDIAASCEVLKGELERLDRIMSRASDDRAAPLSAAMEKLRYALAALQAAEATPSQPQPVQAPAAPTLRDRMVAIGPLPASAFRTRVKIKEPERPREPPALPLPSVRPAAALEDPLTRIRGVDRAMAERLRAQGVTSFGDLERWTAADVKRVAGELGLGRRISRQNWIEQAALLRLREPAAPFEATAPQIVPEPTAIGVRPEPAVVEPVAAPSTVEAAAVPPERRAGSEFETPAAEPIGPGPLAALNAPEAETVIEEKASPVPAPAFDDDVIASIESQQTAGVTRDAELQAPVAPAPEHHESRPSATIAAATATIGQSDLETVTPEPTIDDALAPDSAATIAPEPQAEPGFEAAPAPADDLTLIKGIGDSMAAALREHGVTRFAEIASWQSRDIARVADKLGLPGEVSRRGWIEQATLLSRGVITHHARRVQSGDFLAIVPRPPIEELPPVPRQTAPAATVAPASPAAEHVPVRPPALAFEAASPDAFAAPADLATATIAAKAPPALMLEPAPEIQAPSPASPTAPHLNIEDEEFPELSVDEAEVMIVPRKKAAPPAAVAPRPATPSARSLMARLRRGPPPDDIDPATYAGYRDHVEEASVEIVRIEPATKKRPGPASNPPPASRP